MAGVNQNIQNFYRVAADRDFSRDFLFRVTELNIAGVPPMTEGQLIYAKTASLPGRVIGNVATPYMGLNLNIPGSVTYPGSDSYSITFYLDSQSDLRNFFEGASRALFDDLTSTGGYGTPDETYYITLAQLDKDLNPISNYKLIGASLRNINDVAYSIAAGTGQTVEVTATFAYHFYINPPVNQ
jgi:hypothetical protein